MLTRTQTRYNSIVSLPIITTFYLILVIFDRTLTVSKTTEGPRMSPL